MYNDHGLAFTCYTFLLKIFKIMTKNYSTELEFIYHDKISLQWIYPTFLVIYFMEKLIYVQNHCINNKRNIYHGANGLVLISINWFCDE